MLQCVLIRANKTKIKIRVPLEENWEKIISAA